MFYLVGSCYHFLHVVLLQSSPLKHLSHLKDIKPSPNLWSFFRELENDGVFVGFSTSRISSSRDTPWFHVFHVCCLRCALPESRGWKTWRRYSSCHHHFCFWQATLPGSLGIYVEIRISIIMLKYSHSKPSNVYIPPEQCWSVLWP